MANFDEALQYDVRVCSTSTLPFTATRIPYKGALLQTVKALFLPGGYCSQLMHG